MRNLIWHMHVSLDGFVAGPNGEMDWIIVDEEIFEHGHQAIATADTAIYGRGTYGLMEAYWPTAAQKPGATKHDRDHSAWAAAAQKVVFSRTLKETHWTNVRIAREDPAGEVARLKAQPGKKIIMLGSPGLASTLLNHDLVDEYRFNLIPVILGKGIPLVRDLQVSRRLKLVDHHPYTSGVIGLHYTRG